MGSVKIIILKFYQRRRNFGNQSENSQSTYRYSCGLGSDQIAVPIFHITDTLLHKPQLLYK